MDSDTLNKLHRMLCLLILPVLFAQNAPALELYGETGIGQFKTKVSSTSFSTSAVEARLGTYIMPGLGIELHGASGIGSDTSNAIDVQLDYSANLQTRFETPEREGGKLFFLAGYGLTALDMNRSNTGQPGREEFKSGNFGGGVEYHFQKYPALFLNMKWNRLYAQGGVEIDNTSLSLRITF